MKEGSLCRWGRARRSVSVAERPRAVRRAEAFLGGLGGVGIKVAADLGFWGLGAGGGLTPSCADSIAWAVLPGPRCADKSPEAECWSPFHASAMGPGSECRVCVTLGAWG